MTQDVVVTGYGIVSSLGSDASEIIDNIQGPDSSQAFHCPDAYFPYFTHPAKECHPELVIKKRSHIRGMSKLQLNAVVAAGNALSSAGMSEQDRATLPLIVACTDGDRDRQIDEEIVTGLSASENKDLYINEKLSSLRPTLFLTQLPNLFSANISIALGVTGSSVTFMGDEAAGGNALKIAYERVRSGQEKRILVGGSYGPKYNKVAALAGKKVLHRDEFRSVWARGDRPVCLGEAAGFVVLESRESAEERAAPVRAVLNDVAVDYRARESVDPIRWLESQFDTKADTAGSMTICASACKESLQEQQKSLLDSLGVVYRGSVTRLGCLMEASIPVNVALAALLIDKNVTPAPFSREEPDAPNPSYDRVFVNQIGLERGEYLADLGRGSGEQEGV